MLKKSDAAPAAAGERAAPAAPKILNKPITSDRVILSFERRLTEAERRALARNGIEVDEFLGETAYTARIRHSNVEDLVRASRGINTVQHVKALDEGTAHIKIDPALSMHQSPLKEAERRGQPAPAPTNVVVQLWPDADLDKVKRELEPLGQIVRVSPRTNKIEISVQKYENIAAISKLKEVKYIAPSYAIKSQNTHVARNLGVDIAMTAPHLLTGQGVRVGVWDAGHVAEHHRSFQGRLSVQLPREHVRRHDDRHATHVAGTIAGSGEFDLPAIAGEGRAGSSESMLPAFGEELTGRGRAAPTEVPRAAPLSDTPESVNARYPGMAIGAQVVSFDFNGAAEELIDFLTDTPDAIDVMNNSWGLDLQPNSCVQLAAYAVLDAPDFDAVISGEKSGQPIRRIPIVFAAGNTRNDGICGLTTTAGFPNYRSVIPPGTAKNVITVGAIDADTNAMTEFSSWGPTASGRLKPDVVAPGCRVLKDGEQGIVSMFPPNGLGRMCGTSMATPAVTGVVTLMIEKMVKLGLAKTDVFPSTYKALLIHGAEDLGRPGPDFEYGYGRIRMPATLKLMDDRAFEQARIEREGEVQTDEIRVPAGAAELKVTLVWDDRPTAIFAEEILSNDLDLVLISPAGEQSLPLVLNAIAGKETEPARPGVDSINVVEQVLVQRPEAGIWRIEVRAKKVGSASGGQTYSLVTSVQ